MMDAESCDHLGSRCAPGPFVICNGGPPASKRIQTCREPVESLTNVIDFPSGENAGLSSSPAKSVSRKNFTALGPATGLPRNHQAPAATIAMARIATNQRLKPAVPASGKEVAASILESETDEVDSRWKARSRAD